MADEVDVVVLSLNGVRARVGDPGRFRLPGLRAGEDELRGFLAARVWSSLEGPRALFDRTVVWLTGNRVLLPGITTLVRLVAEVRMEEDDRLHATLYEATPGELRTGMLRLLEVPERKRVSELERLRAPPIRVSGRTMEYALERSRRVQALGAGRVDVAQVPAGHLAELVSELHAVYVQVAAGLPENTAVEVAGGKLKLAGLGRPAEPGLMPAFRQLVTGCCPRWTFPSCCWRSPN
ncbi:DUF4158 domain-containing protein [Streptomyces sp. JV185]|uniref:DUF4158 domain-containing protein n=1 Tax=Streptomyces sp. JV185 TaxID=858638 RepID=UPI002E78B2B5|nr:DUF4158 domain-containing protein [Streptomyces sp. JV185]MEE1768344.1 DUF4158 domain-containing protein [Streptomyces sp. JV185]